MNKLCYSGIFAGTELHFCFRHPDTAAYFGSFLHPDSAIRERDCICTPESDLLDWIRDYGMADDGIAESGISVYRASDALLPHGRVIMHAAAMLWHDKAILFTADSGTGKSTQLRRWMDMYGDEVRIMNGDKPVLRLAGDGRIYVHPSPWKGKENWGDDTLTAELGGVIYLKQGPENRIRRMDPRTAAPFILTQFFSMFEDAAGLAKLCRFEEALLTSVPVWMLENKGDKESAVLTRNALIMEEDNHV